MKQNNYKHGLDFWEYFLGEAKLKYNDGIYTAETTASELEDSLKEYSYEELLDYKRKVLECNRSSITLDYLCEIIDEKIKALAKKLFIDQLKKNYNNPEDELIDLITILLKQQEALKKATKNYVRDSKMLSEPHDFSCEIESSIKKTVYQIRDVSSEIDDENLRTILFLKTPEEWIDLIKLQVDKKVDPLKFKSSLLNFILNRVSNRFDHIPIIVFENVSGNFSISNFSWKDYHEALMGLIWEDVAKFTEEEDERRMDELFPNRKLKNNIKIIMPLMIRYSFEELEKHKIMTFGKESLINDFINSFGTLSNKHKGLYPSSQFFDSDNIEIMNNSVIGHCLRSVLALWIEYGCIDGFNTDIAKCFKFLFNGANIRGLSFDSIRNHLKNIEKQDSSEIKFKTELAKTLAKY